ncbi:MAG: alpha-E domain-containing protein [Candidatus Omnitrophica bacterium]|nr:alpha-E domain-containing protein [Candidatus Omnitrophota bacterium]
MLSRVANTVYWMSRYLERAENYARFMDVNISLAVDLPPLLIEQWEPLVVITGDEKLFKLTYDQYTKEHVIQFLTFDINNPNSILSCLTHARENARSIREIISSEMWRYINELYLSVKESDVTNISNYTDFYHHIKSNTHLINGVMDATLPHNETFHFANLGRLLERADKTDRILDMKYFYLLPKVEDVGSPLDYLQWSALLKSTSAYEAYRKTYGNLDYRTIIEFLIFNRTFPRAVHFCLIEADHSLHAISNTQISTFNNAAEKEMGKIISQLNFNDIDDVFHYGLHEYLDDLQLKLNELGKSIYRTFFSLQETF